MESRERFNCNLCEEKFTDYNFLLHHCQNTHVKIESESRGHIVDYQKTTMETEDSVMSNPMIDNKNYREKSCHDVKSDSNPISGHVKREANCQTSNSQEERDSDQLQFNLDLVKTEMTFDLGSEETYWNKSVAECVESQEFNPGFELKEAGTVVSNKLSTNLINLNKTLCVELTRVDHLLQNGVFISPDMVGADNNSQGPEERFEIKIERNEDEEDIFDVPISTKEETTNFFCESFVKTEEVEIEIPRLKMEEIETRCQICFKTFANRSGMFRHLREVHKGRSKEEWETYCQMKEKEKLLSRTCPICDKVSDTYQENKRHQLKHIQVKNFQCHVCGELFRQRQTMLNHVTRHNGIKEFQCELCLMTAYTKSQMTVHMRTHTKEKRFKCDLCGSKFASNETLKVHMRSHTGEKPFQCQVCKKAFVSGTLLNVHSTLHTGVKKFQCKVCNKLFSQNIHLKTHVRVHTGERPFKCTECDTKFSRKHHLLNHMRIHTGEKPYCCEVCHLRFALKQYLVSHRRVHTGEKPYKCPVCHIGFSQYTERNIHTRRHSQSVYITPNLKRKTRKRIVRSSNPKLDESYE